MFEKPQITMFFSLSKAEMLARTQTTFLIPKENSYPILLLKKDSTFSIDVSVKDLHIFKLTGW